MSIVLENMPPVSDSAEPDAIPALISVPALGELVRKTEAALHAEEETRRLRERELLAQKAREVYGLD